MTYDKPLFLRYKKEIAFNISILLATSALNIAGPLVMREAADAAAESGICARTMLCYLLVLVALYTVKFFYQRFRYWFGERFKNAETLELYRKVFRMSYAKMNELEPTYLTERIGGTVNTIFLLYSTSLAGIFVSGLTMALILFVVFRIDFLLGILFVAQVPLQYIGFKKMLNGEHSKLSRLSEKMQKTSAKNNKDIKAILSDVESIKQFSERSGLLNFIMERVRETNRAERDGNAYAMETCMVLEFMMIFLKNFSYIYIVALFAADQAGMGDLVYLNLVNNLYFDAIADVIDIQINLRALRGAVNFVREEIEANEEADGGKEIGPVEEISYEIQNLGYPGNVLIESGRLEVKKGDVVAICGASGCGKTTLVKTLNKLIPADGLKINGVDAREISNRSLRSRIFYLSQNSYLLPLTIQENIELGIVPSGEGIKKLCDAGFMQKFISDSSWYEKRVWENAANLSGGDRQRILLGRLFLLNPDVIILDESFRSLDEALGQEILEQILTMYAGRIILLISHSDIYLSCCNKRYEIRNRILCS